MLKIRYCGQELFKLGKKQGGKWICPMCGHENAGGIRRYARFVERIERNQPTMLSLMKKTTVNKL